MKLYASEDEAYQIRTGREIVAAYPELYNPWIIQDIKQQLETRAKIRPDIAGGRSIEDIFAIATYDYWQYGIGTAEEFYLELLGATDEKKRQYITFRGRFDYIYHLNKKEDMHLLSNKWHAYQLLKDAYRREVLLLESEQDFPAFAAFCQRHPSFVVKPIGLGQSLGVRKVEVGDSDTHELFNQLFAEIEETNSHWNSIRMWYPHARIGVGGNFICSGATGSIEAGINMCTGMVNTLGIDKFRIAPIDAHPDTHIPIKGIKIPRWRQLCNKAIEMAERVPTLRYIGWDFAYDKDKEWIVIEGNENAELSGSQLIHGGQREEFEYFIGYHPTKEYWWQGKYPSRFENIKSEASSG